MSAHEESGALRGALSSKIKASEVYLGGLFCLQKSVSLIDEIYDDRITMKDLLIRQKRRMIMSIEVCKNYREDNKLRKSFNELSENVYDLSFEYWYQNGYWKDNYNPYSVVEDGKVVANISVNHMNMMMNGEKKYLIQLGTVMTDPEYRGRGYMNELMKEVDKDFMGKCDGIYLFANDSVLDFYPKFGYRVENEYQYSKQVNNLSERTVKKVEMNQKSDWDSIKAIIDESQAFYGFDMVDNSDLDMFYLSEFMKENVFYVERLNAYVVAEEGKEIGRAHV